MANELVEKMWRDYIINGYQILVAFIFILVPLCLWMYGHVAGPSNEVCGAN